MAALYAILLGILQGITEFLPVSNFGHISLIENLLGMGHEGEFFLRRFFMWEHWVQYSPFFIRI